MGRGSLLLSLEVIEKFATIPCAVLLFRSSYRRCAISDWCHRLASLCPVHKPSVCRPVVSHFWVLMVPPHASAICPLSGQSGHGTPDGQDHLAASDPKRTSDILQRTTVLPSVLDRFATTYIARCRCRRRSRSGRRTRRRICR